MREILFRGMRKDNGKWTYGYLYEHEPPIQCIVPANYIPEKSKWYILTTAFADWHMPRQVEFVEVLPETVGQFTGEMDEICAKIFEGDKIQYSSSWNQTAAYKKKYGTTHIVAFQNGRFTNCTAGGSTGKGDIIEVVGNIHEKPELSED